jgi:hypothetical protein
MTMSIEEFNAWQDEKMKELNARLAEEKKAFDSAQLERKREIEDAFLALEDVGLTFSDIDEAERRGKIAIKRLREICPTSSAIDDLEISRTRSIAMMRQLVRLNLFMEWMLFVFLLVPVSVWILCALIYGTLLENRMNMGIPFPLLLYIGGRVQLARDMRKPIRE